MLLSQYIPRRVPQRRLKLGPARLPPLDAWRTVMAGTAPAPADATVAVRAVAVVENEWYCLGANDLGAVRGTARRAGRARRRDMVVAKRGMCLELLADNGWPVFSRNEKESNDKEWRKHTPFGSLLLVSESRPPRCPTPPARTHDAAHAV